MNFFVDRKIKKIAKDENIVAPQIYTEMIDKTLNNLKENERELKPIYKYKMKFAVAMVAIAFVVLPNVSPKMAYAMEKIPIVGELVKIVTIRNYFDREGNSELDANIPNIKNGDDTISNSNESINEEVQELTQRIIDNYYEEKNPENHISVQINSDLITNNEDWFTLKLTIIKSSASSDIQYKYYHIDKKTDKIVKLSDLFVNEEYKEVISEEIKKQMVSRMQEDENLVYWFDEESKEWSFRRVEDNQNFYFSERGNIVIVFDKYEVGPGSSGAPEFEIDKKYYYKFLKDIYKK